MTARSLPGLAVMEWVVGLGQWLVGIGCSKRHCSGPSRGANMGSIVGRFIQWVAEFLDRSLYTVPDVDG
jgi:hypothetical protein